MPKAARPYHASKASIKTSSFEHFLLSTRYDVVVRGRARFSHLPKGAKLPWFVPAHIGLQRRGRITWEEQRDSLTYKAVWRNVEVYASSGLPDFLEPLRVTLEQAGCTQYRYEELNAVAVFRMNGLYEFPGYRTANVDIRDGSPVFIHAFSIDRAERVLRNVFGSDIEIGVWKEHRDPDRGGYGAELRMRGDQSTH